MKFDDDTQPIRQVKGTWLVKPAIFRGGRDTSKTQFDKCGKSHYLLIMNTATLKSTTARKGISILRDYDTAADAKNRVSLRGAKAKYFHVKELSNGSYVLEPRVLVSPDAIPARTLKMLNRSVAQLKKGKASAPIDLSPFI